MKRIYRGFKTDCPTGICLDLCFYNKCYGLGFISSMCNIYHKSYTKLRCTFEFEEWVAHCSKSDGGGSKKLTSTLILQEMHCDQETIICMHQYNLYDNTMLRLQVSSQRTYSIPSFPSSSPWAATHTMVRGNFVSICGRELHLLCVVLDNFLFGKIRLNVSFGLLPIFRNISGVIF